MYTCTGTSQADTGTYKHKGSNDLNGGLQVSMWARARAGPTLGNVHTCLCPETSDRIAEGSWVSGHAHTHRHKQTAMRPSHTLPCLPGPRTDTCSHVRDALPCPSTRVRVRPSQDSREFPETDSSDRRVWGRQPRAAVARDTDVSP